MNGTAGEHRSDASKLPLARLRVLDLTLARAGPTCVRHLADWGADVIRIDPPPSGPDGDHTGSRDGFDYQNLHRDKRAMQLDLKSEDGRHIFYQLVATADVIVENMRAAVKYRLGVDYETVSAINPRVVYGSRRRGSAFSPSRPARPRPTGGQPAPVRANRVKRGTRTPAA